MMRWTLALLFAAASLGQAPQTPAKPPRQHAATSCVPCQDLARQLDDAYGGLDYLWDRKLSLEKSIRITETAIAERAAEISRLESALPPSGRSRRQQEAIDGLKRINAQQRDGIDRQRRELADIERRIVEQNERIAALRVQLQQCEQQRCAPSPAPTPSADPGKPEPPADNAFDLTKVSCPPCQRWANLILDLQVERAALQEELALLETELELEAAGFLNGQFRPLQFTERSARQMLFDDIDDVAGYIEFVEARLRAAWAALTLCLWNCQWVPTPVFKRPYVYGPVIGVGVIGGVLTGGSTPRVTPPIAAPSQPAPPTGTVPDPTPPTSTPMPTPAPPPPQTSCTSATGQWSLAASLSAAPSCLVLGRTPIFNSPIIGTADIRIDTSCLGTMTTRHPNGWSFIHDVTATVEGTAIRVRSRMPYMHTQIFGTVFSSSIDATVSGSSYTGTERHASSSCIDTYDVRGNR